MNDIASGPDGATDLGRRAAGGFGWALAGFGINQIGAFAIGAMASRILGPNQLGVAATAVVLVFWLDVLLDVGMGASLIYEQEQGQTERVKVAFTVNTIVAVVVAAIVFVAAPQVDAFFDAGNVAMFQLVALLVLFKGMNQIPDALLKRDLDFRRRAAADLTRAVIRVGVGVTLLLSDVGPISLVIAAVSAEAAAVVVTWLLVRFRPGLRFDAKMAGEMLRFGAQVFGARLTGMLWLNGDYLVLGHKYGARSAAYANYFQAFRLPEFVLGSVYNLFSTVAFPTYSAARNEGPEMLRQASLRSLRLLCLFGLPVGVGMSLIARDFIPLYAGDGFAAAVRPMEILGVAGGFAAVGFASGDLYAAIGKPRLGIYFNLVGAPILIGGFLLFADRGINAFALVHASVIIPYAAFRIEVANRLIGTTWAQSLRALRPAAVVVVGILAFGLPVRLLTESSTLVMFAIIGAAAVGALAGLFLGDRGAWHELGEQGVKVLHKVRPG